MRILGIGWLGSRTDAYDEMVDFSTRLLGLTPSFQTGDMTVFKLPDGDEFQLFGPANENLPYADQSVAAFLVEDVHTARTELEAKGVPFLGEIEVSGDAAWTYFRAPDGRVYELTHRPESNDLVGER